MHNNERPKLTNLETNVAVCALRGCARAHFFERASPMQSRKVFECIMQYA